MHETLIIIDLAQLTHLEPLEGDNLELRWSKNISNGLALILDELLFEQDILARPGLDLAPWPARRQGYRYEEHTWSG